MTSRYEIRVEGPLSDRAREAFCDMRIEEVAAGACMRGMVIDDAHLLGIMAQVEALDLTVLYARPVPPSGGE